MNAIFREKRVNVSWHNDDSKCKVELLSYVNYAVDELTITC